MNKIQHFFNGDILAEPGRTAGYRPLSPLKIVQAEFFPHGESIGKGRSPT